MVLQSKVLAFSTLLEPSWFEQLVVAIPRLQLLSLELVQKACSLANLFDFEWASVVMMQLQVYSQRVLLPT